MQDYLRRTFDNKQICIDPPAKCGAPVEVRVSDEFLGVLHRDEDDGEVSWALPMAILEEDLPPAPLAPPRR